MLGVPLPGLPLQGQEGEIGNALVREQREFNARQLEMNQDVKTTLARIETLLARILPQGDNGRDA